MKKVLILMLAAFAFISCTNEQPEFKFNLDVSGDVVNVPSNITFEFGASVTNLDSLKSSPLTKLSGKVSNEESTRVYQWLDNYVTKNITDPMPPETSYEIKVMGVVHESTTGITMSVNKTFTNR